MTTDTLTERRCATCGHWLADHGQSGCAADDEAAMGGCDCPAPGAPLVRMESTGWPGFDTSDWECRICGCWDLAACPRGCRWVARNVCSTPACIHLAVGEVILDAFEELTDDHGRRHLEAYLQMWRNMPLADLAARLVEASWLLGIAGGLARLDAEAPEPVEDV